MQEPLITVVGNVGAPPRMRVLASGVVVTDFRIASTPRNEDRSTGAWSDGETLWFGVTCWRALAENVATSLQKGDRVVVTGRLKAQSWTTEQGEKRSGLEIGAATVGFDLARAKAIQEKNPPLTITTDPGFPVDTQTGEVFAGAEPDDLDHEHDHDDLDGDHESGVLDGGGDPLGEPVVTAA